MRDLQTKKTAQEIFCGELSSYVRAPFASGVRGWFYFIIPDGENSFLAAFFRGWRK